MNAKFANAKITSIEEELKVLKAQFFKDSGKKGKIQKFSDLEGLWKGKAEFTFEEIQDAEIKLKTDI